MHAPGQVSMPTVGMGRAGVGSMKNTPIHWKFGAHSGQIYCAETGVQIAQMIGLPVDDGPGPFRDRVSILKKAELICRAANSHEQLIAAMRRLISVASAAQVQSPKPLSTAEVDAIWSEHAAALDYARATLAAAEGME